MRISDWSSDVCSSDLFLISRRIEFDIRTPRPSECVLGWLSFGIDNLQARMLLRSLPDIIALRDLGKDEFEWQIMLEMLISNLPGALSPAASAINRRLLEVALIRSEEHTSELQSLMRISYAVFCLKKKKTKIKA